MLVLIAVGAYPTFAVLMLSPLIVLFIAIFAVAAVPTGLMVAFLISLSVFLFVAGLQGIIELTWPFEIQLPPRGLLRKGGAFYEKGYDHHDRFAGRFLYYDALPWGGARLAGASRALP